MSDSQINFTKMIEMVMVKYNEVVENAYQQLILVSGCTTKDEFERLGYTLKIHENPGNAFNKVVSLYHSVGFESTRHVMSFDISADFTDGSVKFKAKPLVNEMEK